MASLDEILLDGEILLVGVEVLAVLKLGLDLLDQLLLLLLGKLLLLALNLTDVTGGIGHLGNLLCVADLVILLKHPLGIALGLEVAGVHDPGLGAKLLAELVVVGNDDNTTVEGLNGTGKGTEGLAIEVVGGLIKDEDMRLVPHGSGKDDLDLLSSGKGRHTVVGTELTVETAILEVLLDVLGRKRTDIQTGALGDLEIDGLHGLLPTHLLEGLGGKVLARVDGGASILDLVLVVLGLVLLTATNELGNDLLDLGDLATLLIDELDLEGGLLELLLLVGELHGNLDEGLLVLTVVGVTPADVFVGRLGEMGLNVVEGVLGDVGDTGVGVLPDRTLLGLDLSDEELDHGTLTGTVLANAGNTGAEGHLDGDVEEGGLVVDGVREGAAGHLHESLTLGLDTLDGTRLGEAELHLRLGDGEVGAGLGLELDELVEVALEGVELQVLDLKDVGAAIVEKAGIVRHDDGGNILEGVEVVLDPGNVDDVQVVGGLIEEKDIGIPKHGSRKSELHAPSTGEGRHGVVGLGLAILGETDGGQDLADLVLGDVHGLDILIGEDVLDAGQVRLLTLDIGLDEDGADLVSVGEALDLVVGDGAHEGSLTGIVAAEETVVLTTLELHLGVVEQNLGTVREGERAVAKLLGIVVLLLLLGDDHHLLGLDTDSLGGLLGIGIGNESLEADGNVLLPLEVLHHVQVHHGSSNDGGVLNDHGIDAVGGTAQSGLELRSDLGGVATGGDGLVGEGLEALELGNGTLGDLTGLGIGDGLGVGLEGGEEEGKEGGGIDRVVHELGHVVDDDGRLTLGGGGLLAETAEEKGDDHGEGGRLDGLDEGDAGQLVHDLGDLLGLGDGGNDLGVHVLNILVANDLAGGAHGIGGGGLDLLLGVPHAGGDLGDDLGEGNAELLGGGLGEEGDAVEGDDALLPLLLNGEAGEQGGEETLDGEGAHLLTDGGSSLLGGLADLRVLGGGLLETCMSQYWHVILTCSSQHTCHVDKIRENEKEWVRYVACICLRVAWSEYRA